MTPLVLMYVFFDRNGEIKAITPLMDDSLSINFESITCPLAEVEMFLTSEKNPYEYYIKKTERGDGVIYKLTKKVSEIKYTRTLDSYLTKVKDATHHDIITITNNTLEKIISIEINKDFKIAHIHQYGSKEQQEDTTKFFNNDVSTVYVTKHNNPYHLLFSFTFTPKDLLESDILRFKYKDVYNDTSVYTKELISGYGYKEKVD